MKIRNELFLIIIFIILTFGITLQSINKFYLESYYIERERNQILLIGDSLEKSYVQEEVDELENLRGIKVRRIPYEKNGENFLLGIYFGALDLEKLISGNIILNDRKSKNTNTRIIVYGKYIPKTSEVLVITSHVGKIKNSINIYRRFTLNVVMVFFIVGIVLAYFLSIRITKPVVELEEVAKRISRLDFNTGINPNGNTEIKSLGNSIETMRNRLRRALLELSEANEKLKEDIEKEKKIDKMRRSFIAGVNHELKTPITIINSYSYALKKKLKGDEGRGYYCDVILDEVEKMEKMVNRLLFLSKAEAGFLEMRPEEIDVEDELSTLLAKYGAIVKEKGITLTSNLNPLTVTFDREQLGIVLDNLMSNAFKYVKNYGEIRVGTYEERSSGVIKIYNTSDPIGDDKLEKLWNPFFILDKSRSKNGKSTGLGLSIVKNIMDNHRGSYSAENKDSGVLFTIRISKKVS